MKGLRNRVFSILMAVFLVMGMMPAFGTVYAEFFRVGCSSFWLSWCSSAASC